MGTLFRMLVEFQNNEIRRKWQLQQKQLMPNYRLRTTECS